MVLVIKYSEKNDIEDIVKREKNYIGANRINNYYESVMNSPIIVLTGGDDGHWSKKNPRPTPGIVALGKVNHVDEKDDNSKYFSMKIQIKKWFSKTIPSEFFIGYPQTYNSYSIAPLTKNVPNQALVNIDEDKTLAVLRVLLDTNKITIEELKNIFGNDIEERVIDFQLEHLVAEKHHLKENKSVTDGICNNFLIYGAPGTGKSYYIDNNPKYSEYNRITFYPDYEYADFVGGLRPIRNDNGLDYKFIPGPFTETLIDALLNPDKNFGIIIEELNRANSASVFGDVFQLLDRNRYGISRYNIKNRDLSEYIDKKTKSDFDFSKNGIRIPGNMDIIATMNSNDQGVYIIDSAFKRRWIQKYMPIDWSKSKLDDKKLAGFNKTWPEVGKIINEFLLNINDMDIEEDSLMGEFFITEAEYQDEHRVGSKILGYLWNDVARYSRNELFDSNLRTLSQVIIKYESGEPFFVKELQEKLN